MPISRPRRGSQDFGPRGAGQLDERVRIQHLKTKTHRRSQDPVWEDLVPGGSAQNIEDSTVYASVTPRGGASVSEENTQFQTTSKNTRKEYDVRMYHNPQLAADEHRLLWRGLILNITSADHQTERRSGPGYSTLACIAVGNAPVETLEGGSTVGGGPEPNQIGDVANVPIT